MTFTKNIEDLDFNDLKFLLDNKIPESDILDYKEEIVDDNELLKHVNAFANTRGGHIIFGISESGKGGYPTAINGLDPATINKERMEQIILSNIVPRLHVKLCIIENIENNNYVLIMQIPDSAYKPHYNNKNNKFYKRFEFESAPMVEQEISDMYKNRFHTYEEMEDYLNKIMYDNDQEKILLQIIVIPTNLDRRLIDTTNYEEFEWLDPNVVNPQPAGFDFAPHHGFLRSRPKPFTHGLVCNDEKTSLHIHRNGCIQFVRDVGYEVSDYEDTCLLQYPILGVRIMHVLQFAQSVLSRYNYFGEVKILVNLKSLDKNLGVYLSSNFYSSGLQSMNGNKIKIEREYPLDHLKTNFSNITASIMNEIFNHFGIWNCFLFDNDGQYVKENFYR